MLLKHNIPVYDNLEKTLEYGNLAIVVTFTGTGKSYITLEYLDNHNYNALVVVPSLSIGSQWEKMTDRVKTVTFSYLLNHIDDFINEDAYDCYIIDEAHHAGAERWGSAVFRIMTELNKPVIGLTADPIRYSDEFRDVSQEFWDDCIVPGYDLVDALKSGLIPSIDYIYTVFSDNDIIDELNNPQSDDNVPEYFDDDLDDSIEFISKLNYTPENIKAVETVLTKFLGGEKRKGLVFADNIDAAKEAFDIISGIFPDQKVWLVHSNQPAHVNRQYLEEYNFSDDGYIVSVNMLNEGVHVNNADIVIMLRRTFSPSVFFQQIGRAISAGDNTRKNIIVFDFVGNHSAVRKLRFRSAQLNRVADLFINSKTNDDFKSSMTIHGYVYSDKHLTQIKFEDIIRDIVSHTTWTSDEDDIIMKNYPKLGIKKCADLLPGRSPMAVHCRANRLGVRCDSRYWTEEEDNIIREYYPELGARKCSTLLHGRTPESILVRAQLLEVKRISSTWTKEEDNIIKDNYPLLGSDCITLLPNRTKKSISGRASILGVKYTKSSWTEEEDNIIMEHYPSIGSECVKLLPGRTVDTVYQRAKALGVSKAGIVWTEEEDNIIREYYPSIGIKCLDKLPGRNKDALVSRASYLGIKSKVTTWTEEEDNIIREYYPSIGTKCVDMLPKRNRATITARAKVLGVKYVVGEWTEEDDSILKEAYPELGKECYILFNGRKTPSAVQNRANRLGLRVVGNRWTYDEDKILRDNYPAIGYDCVDLIPSKTVYAIAARAQRLGIKRNINWTSEDDNIIRTMYPTQGTACGEFLSIQRNPKSISNRAMELGVKYVGDVWTEEEDNILRLWYPQEGVKCFSRLPHRTFNSIKARVKRLGLRTNK